MRRILPFAAVAALAAAPVALAGWASLGTMPAPNRDGATLTFRNGQGTVAISVLAPEVVRVRFLPARDLGRDHSWAVVSRDLGDPQATFAVGTDLTTIATPALRVAVRHDPFRLAFADSSGDSLDEDDPERGIGFAGREVKVWKRLRDDEHVYGFGEKTGGLDKRGWKLGGAAYAMWNSDTYGYDASTDPLYVSVPFFMVVRAGKAHGIFLDNSFRTHFDVGKESQRLLSFGAEGGALDYYFILGPSPSEVVARYTALTGRIPLPPRWALGYHQCRYSYFPEAKVRWIADTLRLKRIPADVIWLDIHYLDGFAPFTWDPRRFPDPKRMIADLRKQGFRVVTIVDPHPEKQPGHFAYDTGMAGDHFVKNADGTLFEAPVWPANADADAHLSVFPDFSRAATREWWGGLFKFYTDDGVAGIWNDMDEPAVFVDPTGTFPATVRHDNDGAPTDHAEIHNVYGMETSRATYDGLRRLRPDERAFVLTRASFAGGQRYAAVWPGDNVSDWSHLRASIPMLLNLGLSGFAFAGSDIGGFAGAPTAELFTRWLQLGVFYPFMRDHTSFGTPDQEPWAFGARHEEVNRQAIELRYRLLPTIYNEMQKAAETGVPAMRPLFLEFPDDATTWGLDDELMLGRDLLVAPVLREAATERGVYLPAGDWFDYWTGERRAGGEWISVPVTIESLPIFVRAGGLVFRQPVVQHTGELPGRPLEVLVYPAAAASAELYEDDGETMGYTRGAFMKRRFTARIAAGSLTVEVAAPAGSWRPAPRDLELWIRRDGRPERVTIDGAAAPPAATRSEGGFVIVTLRDTFAARSVTVE